MNGALSLFRSKGMQAHSAYRVKDLLHNLRNNIELNRMIIIECMPLHSGQFVRLVSME